MKYTPTSGGSVIIRGSYSGDIKNPPSVGNLSLTVTPKTSRTAVVCIPTSVAALTASATKCTAKVIGYSPTGSVSWSSEGTGAVYPSVGSVCTLSKGSCSVMLAGTLAGKVTIKAKYGGDVSNNESSQTRLLTITPTPSTQNCPAPQGCVKILSTSNFVDTIGYTHIVGEVQNVGTQNLHYVEVTGGFKSANGTDTHSTFTKMDILTPGQKSPFEVISPNPNVLAGSVSLTDASPTTGQPNLGLKVQGVSTIPGHYHVLGEVRNAGTASACYVEVIVTYYGSNGKVVGLSDTFTSPSDVETGGRGSFDTYPNHAVSPPASFTIQVQSTNFTSSSQFCGASFVRDDVRILSNKSYFDSGGYTHVVGEVQNSGTENLKFVEVTGTFYAGNGGVVDTHSTFTWIDILTPGEKSPFEVIGSVQNLVFKHYNISVTDASVTTDQPNGNLLFQEITNSTTQGYYHVQGKVKNTGTSAANFVEVILTFYDGRGDVVGASLTFTSPSSLQADEIAPFDASIDYAVTSIASYTIQVQASS